MPEYFDPPPALKSAGAFMGEPGSHFYIPAYQRGFAWLPSNVERLFDDIVTGAGVLHKDDKSISFIGAMVCFHDLRYTTIDPLIRPDVPARVLTVVDGQQRLIALTMAAGILHDYLRVKAQKLPDCWLKNQTQEAQAQLEGMLEEKTNYGETEFYPRMIRAYADQWARTTDNAKYLSPLSNFVSQYHAFRAANPKKHYVHKIPQGIPQDEIATHRSFESIMRKMRSEVGEIVSGKRRKEDRGEYVLPPVAEMAAPSSGLLSALFRIDEMPEQIDENDGLACEVFRATVLARYIMEKIHFVVVTVKHKEDYAFDIFESLNTTGQILTAFETFVPEVVKYVEPENYGMSESKKHMDGVKKYIDGLGKENQKNRTTAEMITSFALAETGEKVSLLLREQRGYLRRAYKQSGDDIAARERFTRHFMHTSAVYQHLWFGEPDLPDYPDSPFRGWGDQTQKLVGEANFCLYFLVAAGNDIARAVIARFYERVMLADDGEKEACVVNFCKAIKAIAAFFALWRSSRPGTDGIDQRYRRLLKGHNDKEDSANNVAAICRQHGIAPVAADIQAAFVRSLKKDGGNSRRTISSVDEWAGYVNNIPVYPLKGVSQFLLLLAFHDAIPDDDGSGILRRATPNASPLISPNTWLAKDHETVEHVIPQGQASALGIQAEELDYLGNLTLLPRVINSILGDRPWGEKRVIYQILAAETEDARRDMLASADFLNEDSKQKLAKSVHLPLVKAMPLNFGNAKDADSAREVIRKRGENLARMAWLKLSDWVGFDAY